MPAVDGLPVGVQLLAPYFWEGRLLNVAHQYQQVGDWHTRPASKPWQPRSPLPSPGAERRPQGRQRTAQAQRIENTTCNGKP